MNNGIQTFLGTGDVAETIGAQFASLGTVVTKTSPLDTQFHWLIFHWVLGKMRSGQLGKNCNQKKVKNDSLCLSPASCTPQFHHQRMDSYKGILLLKCTFHRGDIKQRKSSLSYMAFSFSTTGCFISKQ